ncbi:MAG TPA: efflux RND transporter periplasmic adaptor subunit [Gemmatimonadales bacterium]|nr:efflux RND transporter periplasmic adaptor subunit [Gemmatimonadales bacterium]
MPLRSWLLPALAVSLVAGCHKGGGGDDDEGGNAPASPTAVAVALAPIRQDTISDVLSLTGRLDATPGSSALLAAPSAGVVHRVRTQVGAEVQAGDTLVELDVPELTAEARSTAAAADVAERESKRQHALLAQGIASARQVEEADNAATTARAAADAAARLLARTRVLSPIEGDVDRVMVQPGERVDAGAPLVQVMDADTLDLVVPVPADHLPRIRKGQAAWVVAEGDSARHAARVFAVAPGVDSVTNAGRIVVRMPNPGERIRVGTGATATVEVGLIRGALVVPAAAVVIVGDRTTVFVVGADSVAHARPVAVTVHAGARVAVTGQLKADERVVTAGAAGLADGMRVVPGPAAE